MVSLNQVRKQVCTETRKYMTLYKIWDPPGNKFQLEPDYVFPYTVVGIIKTTYSAN